MNAFEFEQPIKEDHRRRNNVGARNERELRFLVVCVQCRGAWLWKFREETPARRAAAEHRDWSGHDVTLRLR